MSIPLTPKAKVAAKAKVVAKVKAEGVVRDEAKEAKEKEKENPIKAKAKERKAKAKAKAKAMENSVPVVVRKSDPVDHPQGVSLHLEYPTLSSANFIKLAHVEAEINVVFGTQVNVAIMVRAKDAAMVTDVRFFMALQQLW